MRNFLSLPFTLLGAVLQLLGSTLIVIGLYIRYGNWAVGCAWLDAHTTANNCFREWRDKP
jgi:hypothetical protein